MAQKPYIDLTGGVGAIMSISKRMECASGRGHSATTMVASISYSLNCEALVSDTTRMCDNLQHADAELYAPRIESYCASTPDDRNTRLLAMRATDLVDRICVDQDCIGMGFADREGRADVFRLPAKLSPQRTVDFTARLTPSFAKHAIEKKTRASAEMQEDMTCSD